MSKAPLQNRAYFHFSAAVDKEVFFRSFGDLALYVTPIFPDSFLVRSDASFSDLKHVFSETFAAMPEYAGIHACVLKLEEDGDPLILQSEERGDTQSYLIPAAELLRMAQTIVRNGYDVVEISLIPASDDFPASVHFEAASSSFLSEWVDYEEIDVISP